MPTLGRRLRRVALLCCSALFAMAATAPLARAEAGPAALYFGAFINGHAPTDAAFQPGGAYHEFERLIGKRVSLIHFGMPWKMNGRMLPFEPRYFENIRRHGAIPVVNWLSWELGKGLDQPDFQLRDVYSGTYDAYIAQWAAGAKAWGRPMMLRFDHEMNGWWFPWGEGTTSRGTIVNGNARGDFVKAWRHVHDIFQRVGARNVTWLWAPNVVSLSDGRLPSLESLYPGDAYVDWTGLSAYNEDRDLWRSITTVLTGAGTNWMLDSYGMLGRLAPSKPIMIAETGSAEAGDGGARKAAWVRDFLAQLPAHFPRIKGFMWFQHSVPGYETVRIDSSPASLAAFREGIRIPAYAENRFSGLDRSPIPPLAASPPRRRTLTPVTRRGLRLTFDLSALGGRPLRRAALRIRTRGGRGAGSRRPHVVRAGSRRLGTLRARIRPGRWYSIRLDPAAITGAGRLTLALGARGRDRLRLARGTRFSPRLVVGL